MFWEERGRVRKDTGILTAKPVIYAIPEVL